jgi:LEA14-like dessication related protein
MKHRSSVLLVVVIIVVIMLYYAYRQYEKLYDYDYKISRVKFDAFGLKHIKGSLFIEFENKSNIDILIKDLDINMYVNDVLISKVIPTGETFINSNSISTIELKFDAVPNQILALKNIFALNGILNKEKVLIGFFGNIKISKPPFTVNIPININKPLSYYLTA